jgi:hypothetical protein
MSHITTIKERPGTQTRGQAQPMGPSLWAVGAILGAGLLLGFALTQAGTGLDAPANQIVTQRASVEEFTRINTVALEALVSTPVFRPAAATNHFLDWNTDRLAGAGSASGGYADPFLEWNTTALPGAGPRFESDVGPVLDWNIAGPDYQSVR